MTLFQHHLLGLALISASMSGFGLFVFLKNPQRNLNRSMALYCLSLALWSVWECIALLMPTRELAFWCMRMEYIGVAFIPTLLCTTVTYLLNFSSETRKKILFPLYIISIFTIIFATILPTRKFLWISPGPVAYLPIWGWAGPYYWIFLLFFLGTVVLSHAMIFRAWRHAKNPVRTRLAIFAVGSLLTYLGGCPEFGLKYGIRMGWLNPFGLYAFPFYIGLLIYAVLQHQLFDVTLVIRKSLVYSLLITLLTAGYFGLIYGIEQIFQTTFGYHSLWFSLVAFSFMALLFQPLKGGIQKLVDWLIFRVPQEELAQRMERLEDQALQAEKFKAVSTMAAGMAHEIKNPLTAMKTFIEFIPERRDDQKFLSRLHEILSEEVDRIQCIVQDVLDFSKPKSPCLKSIDLSSLISSTVDLLSSQLAKQKIKWTVDCQHNGSAVQADADQLRQVLINLIQNAADAMCGSQTVRPKQVDSTVRPEALEGERSAQWRNGGTLTVSTRSNNGYVEIIVSDTGYGIPKELLPKIFDPFVTTKSDGNGLGLAMVYSIIQSHHGTIHVESSVGKGTAFIVRLPVWRQKFYLIGR